jgi:hypothetical protein
LEQSKLETDGLPEPDAALVLIRVLVQAHLATISRRRGEAFLRHATEILASEENLELLFPIRPRTQHAALNKARREAVGLFRQLLPSLIASLPTA